MLQEIFQSRLLLCFYPLEFSVVAFLLKEQSLWGGLFLWEPIRSYRSATFELSLVRQGWADRFRLAAHKERSETILEEILQGRSHPKSGDLFVSVGFVGIFDNFSFRN